MSAFPVIVRVVALFDTMLATPVIVCETIF
jgi:hypothetical protein